MTGQDFWRLVAVSLRNPAEAARQILGFAPARGVVWTVLLLSGVLGTLVFLLSDVVSAAPGTFLPPGAYLAISLSGAVGSAVAVFLVGQMFGGQGQFLDILTVFAWLQMLQVVFQAAGFAVGLVVPGLGSIVLFAGLILGLYITVHFIDQAHQLGSPLKAVGVMLAASLMMAFVLSLVLGLILGDSIEGIANV